MAYYYTPFRKKYGPKKENLGCPFCNSKSMLEQTVKYSDGILVENENYRWIVNVFPKFEGHTMIVPKRHIIKLGDESNQEILDRESMTNLAAKTLQKLYKGSGVEIFIQTGIGSESSVEHIHWHVVPSHPSDPLRGFDKLGQFFTIEEDKPKIIVFPIKIRKAKRVLLNALSKTLGRKDSEDESRSTSRRKRK